MTLSAFPGGGADIDEPAWDALIPDGKRDNQVWRSFAHREWLRITAALREAGTLAPENRHQIQRLIIAYVRYDRAAAEVLATGLISRAPKTKTAAANICLSEMRQADADATTAEQELCLPPRRRAAAGKVTRKQKATNAAAAYLTPKVG